MNDCCETPTTGATRTATAQSRERTVSASSSRHVVAAMFVVALMVVSSLAVVGFASGPVSSSVTRATSTHATPASTAQPAATAHATPAAKAHPAGPIPAASSGRGTFFQSSVVPNPVTGTNTCPYTYFCFNQTNEPSANVTTSGYTGVAYTAYTNQSQCPAMDGNSTVPDASTEVGFEVSPNFGSTWSTPIYLGNPVCSGDGANYASAFQPSLTSLPNGTFALAYVEYNYTKQSSYSYAVPPENMYCGGYNAYIDYSRVVMSFSYNNGVSWSTPTVVSETNYTSCPMAGFPYYRPSVTAIGNTIYLSYETVEKPLYYCCSTTVTSTVWFVNSTNDGVTWGTPSQLTTTSGYDSAYSDTTDIAANPNVLVDPSGQIYVAYVTGLNSQYISTPCYCYNYTSSIEVATSTNNGSTWSYAAATNGAGWVNFDFYPPAPFFDPAPYLAYSDTTGELFVTYAANAPAGNYCLNEGIYGYYCGTYYQAETIYVQNSSTNGATWSSQKNVLPTSMIDPNGGWYSSAFNPSIIVDDQGTVHLQFSFLNAGICATGTDQCHLSQQFYMNSTDGGVTWSNPVTVYAFQSEMPFDDGRYYFYSPWMGSYSAMVTAGDQVMLAWTLLACPAASYCYFGYTTGGADVVTSTLYEGTGVSLTFSETGLSAGVTWYASAQGNDYSALAGSTITISGVPPSQVIQFNVDDVNASYGIQYTPTLSATSPGSFAVSTTVTVTFTESVLVNILTVPTIDHYYLSYGWTNYMINSMPGPYWVSLGSSMSESISSNTWTFCYICLNLSFQSWTGSGNGSVSSTNQNITFTANGPVNETANFNLLAWCRPATYGGGCLNVSYPLVFSESGLPTGTNWGVTTIDQTTGLPVFHNSTTSTITLSVGTSPVSYTLWTIPDGASQYWIPSTTAIDPANPLTTPVITVDYTAGAISSADFSTTFEETGLPNGTAWSLELAGSSYGVGAASTVTTLAGGGTYSVNGSYVYLEGGIGFYASGVSYTPYVMNSSTTSSGVPGSYTADGPGVVVVTYSPMYYLTVTSSVGGSASPGNQWVRHSHSVQLNETASSGYHFVGWTGSGGGSITTAVTNPTITPSAPVTELATFRPNAPPTWNLTISGTGLPAGTAAVVTIGGTTYSGVGSFKVGNLTNGSYSVSAPTISLNSTDTTQFVPTSVTSSLSLTSGTLELDGDGTLTVAYQVEYAVSVIATPNGAVTTPSTGSGTYWFAGGVAETLVATPAAGFELVNWTGTGAGSVNATTTTIVVTPAGPITETAQFLPKPIYPPAVYSLTVTETGLPSTLSWSVSVGTTGASGTGTTLKVAGLNGTYKLTAPTVYAGVGTRWTTNAVNVSESVTANATYAVTYYEQFLVSVTNGTGGTATGSSWVNATGSVTLTATAATGFEFLSWNGTGAGWTNSTSATVQLTVTGPVTVQASFAPIPPPPVKTSGGTTSDTSGMLLSIGLLVALLVVGLIVGMMLARRGGRQPPATMQEYESAPSSEPAPEEGSVEAPPAAAYDEGPPST